MADSSSLLLLRSCSSRRRCSASSIRHCRVHSFSGEKESAPKDIPHPPNRLRTKSKVYQKRQADSEGDSQSGMVSPEGKVRADQVGRSTRGSMVRPNDINMNSIHGPNCTFPQPHKHSNINIFQTSYHPCDSLPPYILKVMQRQCEGSRGKGLPIPRYADKYKDMLEQSSKKQPPPPPIETPPPPSSPKSFFFYRIRTIGVGAHSFVSLVQEEASHLLLAEKAVTLAHAREVREDLIREIKILSLADHENIIKLYHCYASETHLNLLLEYAEDSLCALKQRFTVFKEKQVLEVTRQLLNGLQYLHSRGIVHADVKMENVMIANGTVKLCDFGYAHQHDPGKTQVSSQQVVGTMEYLPPEYAQGKDSGPLRDIWAVGILAFEMLTGRTPFQGLKENEKWTKLLKTPPSAYIQELRQCEKAQERHWQRAAELLKHILVPEEQRWGAERLLRSGVFPQ